MAENGRNNVFRGTQAPNKLPLLFLDVKMVEERFDAVNQQARYGV